MTMSNDIRHGNGGTTRNCTPWRNALRQGVAMCAAALVFSGSLGAAEHIVARASLHDAVANRQRATVENKAELMKLLSRPEARTALASAGMEFRKVEQAVAALDENTAASLAARARSANQDFAAGALSNQMLTYIVIALGTAIIVLIAVS